MNLGNQSPFQQALAALRAKGSLPTSLSSKELAEIDAAIRERALFSARTVYASHLQEIFDRVTDLVDGKTDPATVRLALKDSLDGIGYIPIQEDAGTIKDLRSDQRLNLVIETNTKMAHGYGDWMQGQDTLDAYPAQELIRAEDRKEKRTWHERWRGAGGQIFAGMPPGQPIEDGFSEGRMIALKNDPIWETISEFGLPYPPFDYNSGIEVSDVSRAEAEELGLLAPDEEVSPQTRGFNDGLEVAAPVAEGPMRDALLASLGDGYEFDGDVLRKKEA